MKQRGETREERREERGSEGEKGGGKEEGRREFSESILFLFCLFIVIRDIRGDGEEGGGGERGLEMSSMLSEIYLWLRAYCSFSSSDAE